MAVSSDYQCNGAFRDVSREVGARVQNVNRNSPVLLLFSDVNSSPQLIEIVKRLKESQNSFHVVLIGDLDLDISLEMQRLDIPFSLISKRSKYGILLMFFAVGLKLSTFRPKTILASGQYATLVGMLSAYILRVPRRIFIRHHSNFHYRYKMQMGVLLDRMANYLSTDIVAVSQVVKTILTDTEGVKPGKITLIHNGIDVQKFSSAPKPRTRADLGSRDAIRIGIVSRFTEWKGIQYSVDAYIQLHAQYPNSHLYLVGAQADSYLEIKEKLSVLGKSSYTISDWNSDILGFLVSLDIFVHVPIGPEDEAFGLVYVEALASTTACIFTISGILHELPDVERYAEIVPYENSSAIYEAIVKILSNRASDKEVVPSKWLKQFSVVEMAKKYEDLILGGGVYGSK